jgi:hypothetical protein
MSVAAPAVPGRTRRSVERRAATWVGVLYIIGTVAGVVGKLVADPVLTGKDLNAEIVAHPDRLAFGALLVLVMGVALSLVPIAFYPVGKRHSEVLSLGYVMVRGAVEFCVYVAGVVIWLTLVVVGRGGSGTSPSLTGDLRSIEKVLWDQVGVVPFVVGALLFSYILYRYRLVPRWLAGWGLAGAVIYLAPAIGKMFDLDVGFMMIPLAIQEMVLAVWLIAKGFDATVTPDRAMREDRPRGRFDRRSTIDEAGTP